MPRPHGPILRGGAVECAGHPGFAFRLVHCGVCGGIDDDVRSDSPYCPGQRLQVVQVARQWGGTIEVECHDRAERHEGALQFPTDLAVLSEEQDLHRLARLP